MDEKERNDQAIAEEIEHVKQTLRRTDPQQPGKQLPVLLPGRGQSIPVRGNGSREDWRTRFPSETGKRKGENEATGGEIIKNQRIISEAEIDIGEQENFVQNAVESLPEQPQTGQVIN